MGPPPPNQARTTSLRRITPHRRTMNPGPTMQTPQELDRLPQSIHPSAHRRLHPKCALYVRKSPGNTRLNAPNFARNPFDINEIRREIKYGTRFFASIAPFSFVASSLLARERAPAIIWQDSGHS